jgi:hypothetical protein
VQTQPIAPKALGQYRHDSSGVRFQLAANNKIIGPADHKAPPPHARFDLLDEPVIQDIMKEDVAQQRRIYSMNAKDNFEFTRVISYQRSWNNT